MELFKLKEISSSSQWFTKTLMTFEDFPIMKLREFVSYWFEHCNKYGYNHGRVTIYENNKIYGWYDYDISKPMKNQSDSIENVLNYTEHIKSKFGKVIDSINCVKTNEDNQELDLFIHL